MRMAASIIRRFISSFSLSFLSAMPMLFYLRCKLTEHCLVIQIFLLTIFSTLHRLQDSKTYTYKQITMIHTILGAGGIIAKELTKELLANNQKVRLVSRQPKAVAVNTEARAADLTDYEQTKAAVAGSSVVYL